MKELYRDSLALMTDLYELTMAYGYWKEGVHERRTTFCQFFRSNPFEGGYTVTAGLPLAVDFLRDFRFADDDVAYLATLVGNDGEKLFEDGFLDLLRGWEFQCDVDAVPEGRVVFPYEPMLRITGPVWQCQVLETALLNILNFHTLVATKASRVCHAAAGEPVLEFGLRRAQGIDGGVSVARAAYVGGCAGTSNVLAGKLYGVPVRGTHAHSWVMFFGDELEAFERYAAAMPNNCIFLVDTYDTIEGVKNAIEVAKGLRQRGYELTGVRLDSGDLAYLSIQARKLLDAAGFPEVKIVASNSLDEHIITSLKQQDAQITVWGVGTKLATAFDEPALGGVYKLTALHDEEGNWKHTIKLSEQAVKVTNPGRLQVRRFFHDGEFVGDMIWDELTDPLDDRLVDPMDATRQKPMPSGATSEELLVPVFRAGEPVEFDHSLEASRARRVADLERFHTGIHRLLHPHSYPVGLEPALHATKTRLMLEARGLHAPAPANGEASK